MHSSSIFTWFLFSIGAALRFDAQFTGHNLNQAQTAINPLDYDGNWENHEYFPSPSNWRVPFYTVKDATKFEISCAEIFVVVLR
jgi:alpha-1,3-glucan synthase